MLSGDRDREKRSRSESKHPYPETAARVEISLLSYAPGRNDKLAENQIRFPSQYNQTMQRKIFWLVFLILGLLADFLLPFWWAFFATVPIIFIAWWVAYRSDWF